MAETEVDHEASRCISLLQDLPLELTYLAEGNANVIYKVTPVDRELAAHGNCCVMRLRKDLSFTKPTTEVLSAFKARISPLYSHGHENLLLEQALYKLDDRTWQQAASAIKDLEREERPNRPPKRRGVYLPNLDQECHGILMPNLSRGTGTRLLEFKPKWLTQSPSAPQGAVRCRTCSLNAMRRAEGIPRGRGDSGFCPFRLLSTDAAILTDALQNLDPLAAAERFVAAFLSKVQPALLYHQKLQEYHGQVGLNDFLNPEDKDFSVAMALRDCSVFLVIDTSTDQPRIIDVKLADLDLKTPDGGKLEHWAFIEQSLLDSGAYLVAADICAFTSTPR